MMNNEQAVSPSRGKRWAVILTMTPLSLLLCAGWLLFTLSLGNAVITGGGPLSFVVYIVAYLGVALIASASMVVMFKVLVGGVEDNR